MKKALKESLRRRRRRIYSHSMILKATRMKETLKVTKIKEARFVLYLGFRV